MSVSVVQTPRSEICAICNGVGNLPPPAENVQCSFCGGDGELAIPGVRRDLMGTLRKATMFYTELMQRKAEVAVLLRAAAPVADVTRVGDAELAMRLRRMREAG